MRRLRLLVYRFTRLTPRERGQTLILVALSMIVLLGFVGLAVDGAVVLAARRDLVKITDAAALAAAGALSGTPEESDALRQERARARAHEYAMLQGLDPDTAPCWSVEFPEWPDRKVVRVRACRRVPLVFMPLLGHDEAIVRAGPLGSGNEALGQEAEAAPLDIALVHDVSASQCYGNYYTTNENGWCSQLLRNPPDGSPRSYQPYHPTLATRTDVPWLPQCNNSPCCLNPAGQWRACPHGDESPLNAPWQPFAWQQDAARYFVSKLDSRHDQVSVVSFSSRVRSSETPYGWVSYDDAGARVHLGLTNNMAQAMDAIGTSPGSNWATGDRGLYPAGQTNMARGIATGIDALAGPGARDDAVATMILLGDGSPTVTMNGVNPSGCSSSSPGNCTQPRADAMTQAQEAVQAGVIIYTIFVGEPSFAQDHALMLQYIADLTDNGRLEGTYDLPGDYGPAHNAEWFQENVSGNFYLASDGAQLEAAYDSIFEKIYTRLIR